MTTLTNDQQAALEKIGAWMRDPKSTAYLLEGGAGVGKTYLLQSILEEQLGRGEIIVATPTHKATNVIRRKLDAAELPWTRGYDAYSHCGEIVTGTTAALLGIAPVIDEHQTEKETKFGKSGKGILSKLIPRLLVIDEVSMLDCASFLDLVKLGRDRGMKILAVGDAGQLPPVKKQAIPFAKIKNQSTLRQVVRQAEGSAIVELAWAIREGRPWRGIVGRGVERPERVLDAFLAVVDKPGELPEEDRPVFIAYRNCMVDAAQEAACRKVYGHGRLAFAPGELVLCESNLYRDKVLLAANQDELIVERFHEDSRDDTCGVPVTLRHRAGPRGSFRAYYLSPEELADKKHPYNVELAERSTRANNLQQEFNRLPRTDSRRAAVDSERRQAWRAFFEWRSQTVISFRHPFALTSHKSQGSTYRAVYANTADLAKYSAASLYVAVTRPRETLAV